MNLEDDDGWNDEKPEEVECSCRCGQCCRLIIEVDLEDGEREPKIKQQGSPIYLPGEMTASGQPELTGYFLNNKTNGHACVFLDLASNLCSIYPTRPRLCRIFDCAGEGREQLIELGYIEREKQRR